MKALLDHEESMPNWLVWMELPVGRLERLFRRIADFSAMIKAHRRRSFQCLNPFEPCFQPEPSFLTIRRILRRSCTLWKGLGVEFVAPEKKTAAVNQLPAQL
jgi:hypothetical protein